MNIALAAHELAAQSIADRDFNHALYQIIQDELIDRDEQMVVIR